MLLQWALSVFSTIILPTSYDNITMFSEMFNLAGILKKNFNHPKEIVFIN